MLKPLFIALFSATSLAATAQKSDSIFVKAGDDGWIIKHKVKPQETLFSLARRYHVPPAILAGENDLTYQNQLIPGNAFYIPVAAYNMVRSKPYEMPDARPLYHRVADDENLRRISRYSNVQQHDIEQWNNLTDNSVYTGQVLLVGWVLYDATPMPAAESVPQSTVPNQAPAVRTQPLPMPTTPKQRPATQVVYNFPQTEIKKDTVPAAGIDTAKVTSPVEALFNSQTTNGEVVMAEKGSAVFFDMPGSKPGVYYAFHNHVARGNIIRVHNPGNGKTIYVKVIGMLPVTKLYVGSSIGITSNAKAALGIKGAKGWCELAMPPY